MMAPGRLSYRFERRKDTRFQRVIGRTSTRATQRSDLLMNGATQRGACEKTR